MAKARCLIICVMIVTIAGCVASPRSYLVDSKAAGEAVELALLPFENLTENKDAARGVTAMFLVELLRTGQFKLAEPALVQKVMQGSKVRDIGTVGSDTIRAMGSELKVQAVLLGAIIEYNNRKREGKEVPVVGVSVRLVSAKSGKIIWVGTQFRDGSDKETVFGFGRETSPARIAQRVVNDLVKKMSEEMGRSRPGQASEE